MSIKDIYCIYQKGFVSADCLKKFFVIQPSRQQPEYISDKDFFIGIVNNIYEKIRDKNSEDKKSSTSYTSDQITKHKQTIIFPSNDVSDYMTYLCNLNYYISLHKDLLTAGTTHTKQENMSDHLFMPKVYSEKTVRFWKDFFINLNQPTQLIHYTKYLKIYSISTQYNQEIILKKKEQLFETYEIKTLYNQYVDKYYSTEFLQSGQSGNKLVSDYLEYIKAKYMQNITNCETLEATAEKSQQQVVDRCIQNLIQTSYISSISEITDAETLVKLLLVYHEEYYRILKTIRKPKNPIQIRYRNLLKEFLKENHNSLFVSATIPNYDGEDINFKKYELKKDIEKILDTYLYGIKKTISELMPNKIYYAVIFLIYKDYIQQDIQQEVYDPIDKKNITNMHIYIKQYIENNYQKIIQHYQKILTYMSKIYLSISQEQSDDFLQQEAHLRQIIEKQYDMIIENKELEKFKYLQKQQQILPIIDKYLYIDAKNAVHSLSNKKRFLDMRNQPLVFGNNTLLEKYGFKLMNYKYKINNQINISLSNIASWTIEQNNALTLNFSKTCRLFGGIFLIDSDNIPYIFYNYLYDLNKIKNLHLIQIIEFAPNKIYKLFVFFDSTPDNQKVVVINEYGRVIIPPDIFPTYTVTYRELYIVSQIYGCNFFRCKIPNFEYLYLVSPAEYSAYLPSTLIKLKLYDDFIKEFEPVWIVKDIQHNKSLVIINKEKDIIAKAYELKEVYKQLKKINAESIYRIPFHSQIFIKE
jgi:hypothetical protein